VVNQRSCQQKQNHDQKIIWFFAMMTMFCGTIMLIITFLHCVKSGYSPMKWVHFKLKDKIFQITLKISF